MYRELVAPWSAADEELDLSAARALVTQSLHRRRVAPDQLLAAAQPWVELDYAVVEEPDAARRLAFTMARDGELHGWTLWFDATLADGVQLSNAPGESERVYGAIFLPLTAPMRVRKEEQVSLDLRATLVGGDYVWRWDTSVDGDGTRGFAQSSFHGTPLTRRSLALADAATAPALSDDGRIDAEALAMFDGVTPLGDIARRLAERHPEAFADERAARERVTLLARRYAE
jgi:hypothetical protein